MYVNAKIDVCILNFPKQSVTYYFSSNFGLGIQLKDCCAKKTVPSMIECCTFPYDSNSIMHAEVYVAPARGDHQ